jgi:hypothetical protein
MAISGLSRVPIDKKKKKRGNTEEEGKEKERKGKRGGGNERGRAAEVGDGCGGARAKGKRGVTRSSGQSHPFKKIFRKKTPLLRVVVV